MGVAPPEAVHDYLCEPIGLVGLADPLRHDVPAAIALARGCCCRCWAMPARLPDWCVP